MSKLYIFSIIILTFTNSFGQNEFYNKGGIVFLNSGSGSATPTLYVNGNLINQDGAFTNSGSFLELKGNITNNPITPYHYVSTGIERFSGSADQTIYGTWNGTTSNQEQFYNLKIYKTSASGENLILDDNVAGHTVNINAAGSLIFEGSPSTNGIIRTQSTSATGTYTGNYINTLYVQSPATSAITGNSTSYGATTKYIEGKLRRQIATTAGNIYYFPVGVQNGGLDGMEAFDVKINSLSATNSLTGYVNGYTTALVSSSYTFCDVAKVDNDPATANNFSTCTGGPDGIMDLMQLTNHTTHSWDVTPASLPSSVNYDITVYPGTSFISSAGGSTAFATIPCGPYVSVKYLARNGIPGGDNATLGNSPAFQFRQGYFSCITGNVLTGQTGFSNFQFWGASDGNTNLPVELTKFFITPVNNEYFDLNWTTASEFNNSGYYLQRSSGNSSFEDIGWIAGYGSTNTVHNYSFKDHNVLPGIIYYYRLKQLDNDQTFKYSNVLSGILNGAADFNVLSIVPNPTTVNTQAMIYAPENGSLQMKLYDILGQEIKSTQTDLIKGLNNIDINMTGLAAATYLVKFNYNNTTVAKRIIKN